MKTEKKIREAIKFRLQTIEISYQNFRNNPYSKKYVHRLRVELRKLRGILSFLSPILDKKVAKKLKHELKTFGAVLSKKRDIDSVIDLIQKVAINEPSLIEDYAAVFCYLEEERIKEAHFISKKDQLKSYDKHLLHIKEALNHLELDLKHSEMKTLEEFVEKRFKSKTKHLKKKYKNLDVTDYEQIHDVRKEAKKVRYTAVGFKKILPKKKQKDGKKEAKAIQENLGRKTDRYVMIKYLKQFREHATGDILKESFQTLVDYYSM